MDSLKHTQDLEKREVIKPVNELTEWVNSLVATKKKNGSLRVCLDPCNLNEAVKRQHYSIPTPEDMGSKLAGKTIFTMLDEKDGYWQIKLDEPPVLVQNCAPLLRHGADTAFSGFRLGLRQRADDAKIKAIIDMPPPEDKQSLQRLLGMTKFLAQHIPNEASLTAPLRQLLKKDAVWQWCPHHSAALETLKTALTQAPVLVYYDHKKPLTLQADSSKGGLGACLLQDERPLCYASRALTVTEKRYAQIEKELLAIVFAAKRFHQYVFGSDCAVRS
ncbi:hypothetical protein D5F01_LYC15444 [Larimichthys crocea]|uniref:Reverse transcriptase/retrotransposon-derived protein RNase H-like domain-containing protein n=1 Tax=Larimichthys crocea TaxID=215358 RepID=A0A6G0I3J6_LARCR|nr:hypothetical protein D5F01_LYC15444 [Larimichthys crocea]